MGQEKWIGGELDALTGTIYGVPGHATQVLRVRPAPGTGSATEQTGSQQPPQVDLIGPHFLGKFKWLRGIFCPETRCIYGIPANNTALLKIRCGISPTSIDQGIETVSLVGDGFDDATRNMNWQWHGAVRAPNNGCIYAVPCNATGVLKIEPVSEEPPTERLSLLREVIADTHADNSEQQKP